jgi:hypothetical protein
MKSKEHQVIEFLWGLLDDLDTAGDIAKNNHHFYRSMAEEIHKRRHETGITTDGYELDLSNMKVPEKAGELK